MRRVFAFSELGLAAAALGAFEGHGKLADLPPPLMTAGADHHTGTADRLVRVPEIAELLVD